MDNNELIRAYREYIIDGYDKYPRGYYDIYGMYDENDEPEFLTYKGWDWTYVEQEQG